MLQCDELRENSSSKVENPEYVNCDDTIPDYPLQTASGVSQLPSATWQSVPTINSYSVDISTTNLSKGPSSIDIFTANLSMDPSSIDISTANLSMDASSIDISTANSATDPSSIDISTANSATDPSPLDISTANSATDPSSPSISVATNLSIASALPGISASTNLAIVDYSAEISDTSNLEMLNSLVEQLANASTDNFMTSQGLQFEEVDVARYTSEPAYFQPHVKPNSQEEIFYSLQFVPCNDVDMVDGGETDQALNFDHVKLETLSNENVELDEVGIARRVTKQENVETERFSNEDVEITDTEDMKITIQGGKTRKKRKLPKTNKRSDQPAKLPPLPLESQLFDDPEPQIANRKEKSLTLLAQKMLQMFPMQGMELTQAIQLDQVAKYLGTQMGRLGVIVDVFEALHIMSKLDKNLYNWHGCSFLMPTLIWLRQISVEMGVPEQYEFVKNKELEVILMNARKQNNSEEVLPDDRQGASSESPEETACMSPKYNSKYCGNTSVGINTQLFLMLMLVAPDPKTVNLEFAASVMHGSTSHKKRNHIRRFHDVSNILSCLGLVVKVRTATAQGSRNAFQYNGPHLLDDMELPELVKMGMPISRQKNSVFPYPKSTENNDKNVEMKKRGRKLGSKNKKKENDSETIEEDGNKEVIDQNVNGMKRRGRKPGQKIAKKVKTAKDVVNEIVETLINEMLEIPENIVKKKRRRNTSDKKKFPENDNSKLWWKKVKLCEYLKKVENISVETDENVNEINVGGCNGKENSFKIIKAKKDGKVIMDRDIDEKKSIEVDTKKLSKRNHSENVETIQIGADNEDGVKIGLDSGKFDDVKSHKRKLSKKIDIVQIDADEGDGTKIRLDKGDEHAVKGRKRKLSKNIESDQIGTDDEDSFKIDLDSCEKSGPKRRKGKLSEMMKIVQIGTDEDDGIKSIQSKSHQKNEKVELRKDVNDNTNLGEHGIRRSRRIDKWNKGKNDLTDKVSNDKGKIVKLRNIRKDVNEESKSLKIKYDLTDANCFDLINSEDPNSLNLVSNDKRKIVKLRNIRKDVNEESKSLKIKYDLTDANCFDLINSEDPNSLNLALVCEIEREKMKKDMSIV